MIALALPILIAAAAAATLFALRRNVRPQLAVVLLTATVTGTVVAATGLLALLALVLLFDPHSTTWCERFLGHGSHRALLPGMLLAAVVLLILARAGRSLVRARHMLGGQRTAPDTPVEVLASSRLIAYARPGPPGPLSSCRRGCSKRFPARGSWCSSRTSARISATATTATSRSPKPARGRSRCSLR